MIECKIIGGLHVRKENLILSQRSWQLFAVQLLEKSGRGIEILTLSLKWNWNRREQNVLENVGMPLVLVEEPMRLCYIVWGYGLKKMTLCF